MLNIAKLFVILQLFVCSTAQTSNSNTLRSVQILFRHGTREPDAIFGQPVGILTPIGKQQMYDLGMYFRQRYGHLISTSYDANEIFIMSTDFDRTIQSALLVAFGLFKDFNMAANWNDDENIQFEPIPVRVLHKKIDKYIQMQSDCPRRSELEAGVLVSYFNTYLKENRELVNYYANYSGDQTILDNSKGSRERINGMVITQQQLVMDLANNLEIADWAKPLLENKAFLSIESAAMAEIVNTVERKKFHVGPLVKLFIENMEQPTVTRKKMHLFSAHDRSLALLLFSLGISDPLVFTLPPTGASLIIELHEQPEKELKHFVMFWYRNNSHKDPYELEIPNCGTPCYLSTFKVLTEPIIPFDFEAECLNEVNSILNKNEQAINHGNVVLMSLTFLAFVLVLTVISIFQIVFTVRKNYHKL